MRRVLAGLAIGALMLAACSKPAESSNAANVATNTAAATPAAAPAAPATPAATGPAGPIALADLPAPTAGKWTRVSTQDGGAPSTDPKCLSGKPIDPMEGLPMKCAKMDASRTATGGFMIVAECANNGINAKLTLAGEGDFSKSFSTDATMVMTGGPGGDLTTKNHSTYTYVGGTCTKPAETARPAR